MSEAGFKGLLIIKFLIVAKWVTYVLSALKIHRQIFVAIYTILSSLSDRRPKVVK